MLSLVLILFFLTLAVVGRGSSSLVRDLRTASEDGKSKKVAITAESGSRGSDLSCQSGLDV